MNTIIIVIFAIGYLAIILEHNINLNKTASALLTGVLCWTVYILFHHDLQEVNHLLSEHLSSISEILFFLLGAMTILELIDAHKGFSLITDRITTTNPVKLVWIIGIISFVLSAVLDSLASAIVMIMLLRKIIGDDKQRNIFAGLVIIAVNSSAWSVIGPVTSTMLWIGKQISPLHTAIYMFIPALIGLLAAILYFSWVLKKKPLLLVGQNESPLQVENPLQVEYTIQEQNPLQKETPLQVENSLHSLQEENTIEGEIEEATINERFGLMLVTGILALLFVPFFKTYTHLPPYIGMMLSLSIVWIISEIIHKDKDAETRKAYSIVNALTKIDTPSLLFFLGILLAVGSLEATGILQSLAETMKQNIGNLDIVAIAIGLSSSVIDNVPLVAASQGMFDLAQYPMDDHLWQLINYCAATGGSILIIGSAAGVAVMGMEKIGFGWYLRHITLPATIAYFVGIGVFLLIG